jgi:hypothetical protein
MGGESQIVFLSFPQTPGPEDLTVFSKFPLKTQYMWAVCNNESILKRIGKKDDEKIVRR